jgi:hypothetical protein
MMPYFDVRYAAATARQGHEFPLTVRYSSTARRRGSLVFGLEVVQWEEDRIDLQEEAAEEETKAPMGAHRKGLGKTTWLCF